MKSWRYLGLIAMLCPSFVLAQAPAAAPLVITTHSLQSQPIPNASVTVRSAPGNIAFPRINPVTVETSAAGEARFPEILPGRYRITILAKGFDELTTDIDVSSTLDNPGTTIDAVLTTVGTHTDSITVQGVIDTPLEEANTPAVLERQQVRNLPDRPRTVTDALPLAPGVVRLPNGQLRLSGSGEHRSALLVNSATSTDPATGQFGATVPIDSVRTMNILSSPFLAEYGGFTADVIAVETRKGGDKWSFELNDPLPEFRWRSWHMVGLRSSTPRFSFGGPLIKNRLSILESVQYDMRESPVITLSFPNNETRREGYNSLTAMDLTVNQSNLITSTFHVADQHTRFANLDFFNPRPTSPNTADSSYAADITDHASFHGTLLDSAISGTSFRDGVWPQGDLPMVLTPSLNTGNYFSHQSRNSARLEWRETWSFSKQLFGTHNLKFGSVVGGTNEHALVNEHPVNILDAPNGLLLETITFAPGLPISRNDIESAFFVQDQWIFNAHASLNLGLRAEQQEVTDSFRLGPRVGIVVTPFASGRTILRAGTGIFYDRVPLNVYGFAFYPDQVITTYNPDGSIATGPFRYFNLTESAAPHHSPLIYRQNGVGDFAPYSINTNLQIEQIVTPRLRVRANYLISHSEELIVVAPRITPTEHAFVLNGDGNSRLRQLEFTTAATIGKESQIYASFVHSYNVGNLNEFNTYLASFPPPVILPDARTYLPGDAPNRFLTWGTLAFPMKIRIMPKVEYRSGFPWSPLNPAQEYIGTPNQNRFPSAFSVDARITKDFKVTDKYSVRFGLSGSNLTNHFNPISVHANSGDPAYGVFFGEYRRRYTADFDVLF